MFYEYQAKNEVGIALSASVFQSYILHLFEISQPRRFVTLKLWAWNLGQASQIIARTNYLVNRVNNF